VSELLAKLAAIREEKYPAEMPADEVEKSRLEKHRAILHQRRRKGNKVYLAE
jgi:hypothetical protein